MKPVLAALMFGILVSGCTSLPQTQEVGSVSNHDASARSPAVQPSVCTLSIKRQEGYLYDKNLNLIKAWLFNDAPQKSDAQEFINDGTCSDVQRYELRDLLSAVYTKAIRDPEDCILYIDDSNRAYLLNRNADQLERWIWYGVPKFKKLKKYITSGACRNIHSYQTREVLRVLLN